MKRLLGTTLQIEVRAWAVVVFVLVIVGAVVAGVTLYGVQDQRTNRALHAETLERQYELCTKIGGVLGSLHDVVDTAFKGTVTITPAQVRQLPTTTRELLNKLEPLLRDSANASKVTKAQVLAKVPTPPTCRNPVPSVPRGRGQ